MRDSLDHASKEPTTIIMFIGIFHIYMLFTGREVRMGKNCAQGLEYGPRPQAEGCTQDQGHSFFPYGPT